MRGVAAAHIRLSDVDRDFAHRATVVYPCLLVKVRLTHNGPVVIVATSGGGSSCGMNIAGEGTRKCGG